MTPPTQTLIDQSLGIRQAIVRMLKGIPTEQAEVMPPTWKNNARWHAGHLIVTPYLLTQGVMKQPLSVPEEYRAWFGKGSTPDAWGDAPIPKFDELADEVVPSLGRLFDILRDRLDDPFLEPYTTSLGVVLHTPAQALNFSMAHDGIHLGLLLALKRALSAT